MIDPILTPARPYFILSREQREQLDKEKKMKTVAISTEPGFSADDAKCLCRIRHGWTPDEVRRVDSGNEYEERWMCFESAVDAELWDNQK